MEFEDDPRKAAANLRKHKVSFAEAASVFGDAIALTFSDPDPLLSKTKIALGRPGE